MKAVITEQGWIAYFICADRCRFRRHTLIEAGRQRVVVATVGLFYANANDAEPTLIGHDRFYETRAFHAKRAGVYWDADVFRPLAFTSPSAMPDWKAANCDLHANEMHETVVKEITENLES